MRRTGSLVAAAALLAVSTPVWASVAPAPAVQAAAPAPRAAPVADLVAAGVIRRELDGVKLLGKGEIKSALKLTVYSATETAIKAVEAAGGSVTVTKKAKAQAEA